MIKLSCKKGNVAKIRKETERKGGGERERERERERMESGDTERKEWREGGKEKRSRSRICLASASLGREGQHLPQRFFTVLFERTHKGTFANQRKFYQNSMHNTWQKYEKCVAKRHS
jgi:hypothetical protein